MKLAESLDRIYATRFPTSDLPTRARLWRTIYESALARYVAPEDTVVDLGAGYCELINTVRAGRRIAIDLNPDAAQFAEAGVEFHNVPLERLGEVVAEESVDLAFASNVFEHLPGVGPLLEVLDALFRALKPGGKVVVLQPNVAVLGGRFWDFFDHTCPLTERGMAEALTVTGFEVMECRGRFLPYTTKSRLPKWPWIVRLYLALRPAQWVFGAQMLVVARRPL